MKWDFDFSVKLTNHMVTVLPGQVVNVPVTVTLDGGEAHPVLLSVSTNWQSAGLIAQIIPAELTPNPNGLAMMVIGTSEATQPGSYFFTIRGETEGTFSTSQDAVTVNVLPNTKENQENQKNQNPQQQPEQQSELGPDVNSPSLASTGNFRPLQKPQFPEAKKVAQGAAKGDAGVAMGIFSTLMFVGILVLLGAMLYNSGALNGFGIGSQNGGGHFQFNQGPAFNQLKGLQNGSLNW